ncbi:MAG: hypothetical protein GX241_06190 [Ruminococcaceae bacterium]|nr:hypothetical protein [Oscillospiraceae bacterium]
MKFLSFALSFFEYKMLWPSYFAICKILYKVDENKVLFADAFASDLTDNMTPIYTALEKRDGLSLFKSFPKDMSRISRSKEALNFLKLYSQCGTLFLTDSMLPAYAVKKRKKTKVVQLWHACGAFKKWGYSNLSGSFGVNEKKAKIFPMHNCYDLVPVSSAEIIPHYAEAFRCSEDIIKPLGVPRTDEMFLKSTPEKIILYAPTFRGENVTSAHNDSIDIEKLKNAFPDYEIIEKYHPFVKCKGENLNTNEILKKTEVLITDYSSIIFEFSLLNRPMIFFAYDLEEYRKERDFYYPYEEFVPGPIVKNMDELIEAIKAAIAANTSAASLVTSSNISSVGLSTNSSISTTTTKFDFASVSKKLDKYMSACDGHSTERILKELGF